MDLCATPAVELARLIRARELSAAELLAAVLARIDEANPAINAIVTLAAEQASDTAGGGDQRRADGHLHRLDALLLADHGDRAPPRSPCRPG